MPRINVKDKRKQQLMEANMISIARRGLADTTIAHVSKGAQMSRGIVNFYFTSKEKMMLETLAFLAEEYTQSWQEALLAARAKTQDPRQLLACLTQTLLGDKLCSSKRMAVWAAFVGHAGTHAAYARIIRLMDEALLKQLKELWQKVVSDPKAALQRARQMQAMIRGHHLMSGLGVDDKRPSFYCDSWLEWVSAAPGEPAADKVTRLKPAAAKSKKPVSEPLPGQLDFGDLFSRS